ncbi:unnamed protein product [Lymnaea stagnalis]|uniref:Cyclic nucleotide-binding domain-containing protein n=1 Tax=Lymnaea stagnalis TaxID=6523 RepID=A0AAV2I0N9_LYMST
MAVALGQIKQDTRMRLVTNKRAKLTRVTRNYGRIMTPARPKREETKLEPPGVKVNTQTAQECVRESSHLTDIWSAGDDLSVADSRSRSERMAEFEIDHNWMLKEEADKQAKQFERTKKLLTISLPDEDPLEGIHNRLDEIQSMVKPKVELSDFLSKLTTEQREVIKNVSDLEVNAMKRTRRKDWTASDYLRHAFKMVHLIVCADRNSRRYFYPDDPEAGQIVMRKQRLLHMGGKEHAPVKASISIDLQNILMTNPRYRSEEHIKRVLWLLKTTKAFVHLFPVEMVNELAKVVAYERYDDNRHIAYQGRPSDRLYFVLTGRIQKLREYKLPSGSVNKPMGSMQKGHMSDVSSCIDNLIREYHLVAHGAVEVLVLSKLDYFNLLHSTQGLPIDFLYSIDLFKEFKRDALMNGATSINCRYYGKDKEICTDVDKTPWLHIIKSGHVKVVRCQQVFDTRGGVQLVGDGEEPGCGRTFSHAKAMLGNLESQRRMRTLTDNNLFQLMRRRSPRNSSDEGVKMKSRSKPVDSEMKENTELEDSGSTQQPEGWTQQPEDTTPSQAASDFSLPAIVINNGPVKSSRTQHSGKQSGVYWSRGPVTKDQPMAELSQSSEHPRTFLTRDKTTAELAVKVTSPRHQKDVPLRRAYVQLDILKAGDVFGLEDVSRKFKMEQRDLEESTDHEALSAISSSDDDPRTVSLVSDGAEIIKISKRFFLQHARNNTMLRVETLQRSYLTPEETKQVLRSKDTWTQYKKVLMKRILASLAK